MNRSAPFFDRFLGTVKIEQPKMRKPRRDHDVRGHGQRYAPSQSSLERCRMPRMEEALRANRAAFPVVPAGRGAERGAALLAIGAGGRLGAGAARFAEAGCGRRPARG
jgi:hypothetical protein